LNNSGLELNLVSLAGTWFKSSVLIITIDFILVVSSGR
jgi:hypothetical protein